MRALPDVNCLSALFDDAYLHSERANAFIATPRLKIATCPLIENGVIRVMNLPGYGHQQVTDVYLLALAVKHKGGLTAFDRGMALSAVVGAQPRHLKLL